MICEIDYNEFMKLVNYEMDGYLKPVYTEEENLSRSVVSHMEVLATILLSVHNIKY